MSFMNQVSIGKVNQLSKQVSYITTQVIYASKYGVSPSNPDNATALQNAINDLNTYLYTAFNTTSMPTRGGKIVLPAGVLNCSGVTYKSMIEFEGAGIYATRFNPVAKSDGTWNSFMFMRDYTSGQIGRSAKVTFKNFTISPVDEVFVYSGAKTQATIGGIDLSYSASMYVKNVCINNLAGSGLWLKQTFDSYFDGVEMFYTGDTSANPALALYSGNENGTTDTSNALHFVRCRFEQCGLLDMNGYFNNVNSQLREIQFVACKFELVKINIQHVASFVFSACHFTWNRNDLKMLTIGGATADTRNLIFGDCTYISGTSFTGYMFEIIGPSTYDLKIDGGACSNIKQLVEANGNALQIIGVSAVNVGSPFINGITKAIVTNCKFYLSDQADYFIKGNNRNKIANNHFDNIDFGISVAEENHILFNNLVAKTYSYWNPTTAYSVGSKVLSNGNTYVCTVAGTSGSGTVGQGLSGTSGNITDGTVTWNFYNSTAFYLTNGADTLINNKPEGFATKIGYSNASFQLTTHVSTYRTSPVQTAFNVQNTVTIGVNNAYSTALSISGSGYDYMSNPRLNIALGGTFGSPETVTVKVQFNWDDGTTTYVEKPYTATGGGWLTDDDYYNLISARKNLNSISCYVKTSLATTTATVTIKCYSNIN